jgi:hypothetical protein
MTDSKEWIGAVNNFNSTLKQLTNDLVRRFPNDAAIVRAKKRIMLAISADPIYIIKDVVGPILYTYRKEIFSGNDAFFMANTYKEHFETGENKDNIDLSAYIIPKVKEAWKVSTKGVRDQYKETVQDLLDDYLDYLAAVKI